jgi:bifunctional DNA-binding transcriptional regulator/antitoxin component of YhaV-PrlF toxin-antitoxin module
MITAKVDNRRRVTVPVEPGQVLEVVENPDGTITLAPIKAHERKAGILDGITPLPDKVMDRIYRQRPANEGLDDLDRITAGQAFHSEE